ncbi:MAG: hypothetical protein M1814_005929 [Vezdaea aestivalis]|nr:MAG: hypothetical protein M1814_005929 [Vezdaea aestivalis]
MHTHTSAPRAFLRRASPPQSRRFHPTRRRLEPPRDDYYELLLTTPAPQSASQRRPALDSSSKTEDDGPIAKSRVVFGSRLAGPAERQSARLQKSQTIAGVPVPLRPEEPDNCCMSGCVNCVWDIFREDLEEWAAKSAEARNRIATRDLSGGGGSMDDDGGGSEANWTGIGIQQGDELFEGIPVGIREFMKTEKRLKEKRTKRKV